MTAAASIRSTPRRRVVLLLSGAAGYLDAVSYLALGLFTANMTGNTVLLGLFAGEGRWSAAVRAFLALASFFAGAAAAAAATRRASRLAGVLAAESGVLVSALLYWAFVLGHPRDPVREPGVFALIALLSGAMGVQSAAVRRVGELRISTTYVTGTLTSLASDLGADVLARLGGRRRRGSPQAYDPGSRLLAGVWGSYLVGAVAGGRPPIPAAIPGAEAPCRRPRTNRRCHAAASRGAGAQAHPDPLATARMLLGAATTSRTLPAPPSCSSGPDARGPSRRTGANP